MSDEDIVKWIEPVEYSEIEREALAKRAAAKTVKFSKEVNS
jgi:hypothetical protein